MTPALTFLSDRAFAIEGVALALTAIVDGQAHVARDGAAVDVTVGEGAGVATMRAELLDGADAPEALAGLVGGTLRSALRIEIAATGISPEAVALETVAFALLADLTAGVGGVVWDDLGFAYDPAEVELLGNRGGSRYDTFAYGSMLATDAPLAATARPSQNRAANANARTAVAFSDLGADLVVSGAPVFLFDSAHLPLLEASRALLAAGDGTVPAIAVAPDIDPAELAVLAPFVVRATSDFEPAADPSADSRLRQRAVRREVLFFSALPIGPQRVQTIVRNFVEDRRLSAELSGDPVANVTFAGEGELAIADPHYPVAVASFTEGSVRLVVHAFPLPVARTELAALLSLWKRPAAILGLDPQSATVTELVFPAGASERDLYRLDVLSTALTYRLAAATGAVVALGSGALIGGDEVGHLLSGARGLSASWSAWSGERVPQPLAGASLGGDRR